MSRLIPSNSYLAILALTLSGVCLYLLVPASDGPDSPPDLSRASASSRLPLPTTSEAVREPPSEPPSEALLDVSFSDISGSACGPVWTPTPAPELVPEAWDLKGSIRIHEPLEFVIRATPLCHEEGLPSGPTLSQQVDPAGEFCFSDLPKGFYRLEVVGREGPLILQAYQGYCCTCDFDGREPSAVVAHRNERRWSIRFGFQLVVEVLEKGSGAPLSGARVGRTTGSLPGRVSLWWGLSKDPRTLGHISAPGYARVPVPGLPFRRPSPPIRVELDPEFPLRVRLVGKRSEAVWVRVHQSEDSCPGASDPRGCVGFAHEWSSYVSLRQDEVVVSGLPATRGQRMVSVYTSGGGTQHVVVPGEQSEVALELRGTREPATSSRE